MARTPTAHSDPIAFANRPLERGFCPYSAVREHVRKLIAGKPDKKQIADNAK